MEVGCDSVKEYNIVRPIRTLIPRNRRATLPDVAIRSAIIFAFPFSAVADIDPKGLIDQVDHFGSAIAV